MVGTAGTLLKCRKLLLCGPLSNSATQMYNTRLLFFHCRSRTSDLLSAFVFKSTYLAIMPFRMLPTSYSGCLIPLKESCGNVGCILRIFSIEPHSTGPPAMRKKAMLVFASKNNVDDNPPPHPPHLFTRREHKRTVKRSLIRRRMMPMDCICASIRMK